MKSKSEIKKAAEAFDALTPEERKEELVQLGFTEEEIAEVEKKLNPLNKGNGNDEGDGDGDGNPQPPKKDKKKKPVGGPFFEEWKLVRSEGTVQRLKLLKTVSISHERAERLNAHKDNSLLEYVLVED